MGRCGLVRATGLRGADLDFATFDLTVLDLIPFAWLDLDRPADFAGARFDATLRPLRAVFARPVAFTALRAMRSAPLLCPDRCAGSP
jgi:hypothetical protein